MRPVLRYLQPMADADHGSSPLSPVPGAASPAETSEAAPDAGGSTVDLDEDIPVPIPESVEAYYAETTEAHKYLLTILANYRANTTTLLAVATGAAAFFGFAASPKGILFVLALIAYAVAATMAMWIFWPIGLPTNMAQNAIRNMFEDPPPTDKQAKFRLTRLRQRAIARAEQAIGGGYVRRKKDRRTNAYVPVGGLSGRLHAIGISWRFRALIVAVGFTVVFAGANSILEQPKADPGPTRVIIEKGD